MPDLTASIDWLVGVVRVHPPGAGGGEYTWACTVRRLPGGVAELMGVDRAPTFAEARAVTRALRSLGLTVRIDRRLPGRTPLEKPPRTDRAT